MKNIPQIPMEDEKFDSINNVKIKTNLGWRDFIIMIANFYENNKDKLQDSA